MLASEGDKQDGSKTRNRFSKSQEWEEGIFPPKLNPFPEHRADAEEWSESENQSFPESDQNGTSTESLSFKTISVSDEDSIDDEEKENKRANKVKSASQNEKLL